MFLSFINYSIVVNIFVLTMVIEYSSNIPITIINLITVIKSRDQNRPSLDYPTSVSSHLETSIMRVFNTWSFYNLTTRFILLYLIELTFKPISLDNTQISVNSVEYNIQ